MCFQHRFETLQRQFRNSNVLGQWVPNNRSGDTEASGPKATGPGSRHSQVASMSRTQVSPGANLPDGIAGAAEVCRTSTVEGVVDEDRNLEVDPLMDGKPVKLIPQHRSDVVELPPVRGQPGCRVEDGLQSSYDNVCGTVNDTVAIIDTTWYEGMDQCFRGIRGKWSSDGSQLSQLIETASSDVVDMQVIPCSLSNVFPRFLAEVEDLMECLPIVMVFVSIFANCCLDPSHKNWVLSQFSFSRFDFIHPSTLSMHSANLRAAVDWSTARQWR